VGAVTGVLSGLLGIGGGTLLVPFLYLLMANPQWSGVGVDGVHHAAMAHATSLAVILPTALSGLRSFRRHGLVDWEVVAPLGMAAAVAAFVGAQLAAQLPGTLLKALFGCLLLVVGARMVGVGLRGAPSPEARPGGSVALRPWAAVAGGSSVGLCSALLGIGGGVLAVPVLVRWARMDLHRVTAASIAIVTFAAPAGILSYALAGRGVEGLPPGSLGYVSLPLAAALVPGAVLAAPLGARINRSLPAPALRRVFGILLVLVGARLLSLHGLVLMGGP
jgi:uncharacterized membrane protein YfcA